MDRIEIGKLSAAYDVRRLGLADTPVVYAFCKADTQYYARCGAEVTLARAPAAGSSRRRWPHCRRRASGGAYWGWTRITPSPPTSGERTASGWCGSCRRTEVPSRWRKGSWTDKGGADEATVRLLKTLQNRRIFLFGTAGFGGSEAYFQRILDNAQRSIDPSNTVIGTYMCQGRMPQTVRERYVKMKGQPEHPANLDALIENFDRALSHPDGEDLRALQEAVLR